MAGPLALEDAPSRVGEGRTEVSSDRAGLFPVVLAFLLPVLYLEATYHTFLAAKASLALVALVPGLVALARLARRPGEMRRAARCALGFCAVAGLAMALADVPLLSLTGPAGDGTGLIFVVVCAGCWAMGTRLDERRRHLVGTAIVGAAVVNAVIAWLQGRGWVPPVLEMETSGPLAGRAFGLVGNPVHLGALCVGGLLLVGSRLRASTRAPVLLVFAFLLAGAAQLSGTRTALALIVLGVIGVVVRWWPGWQRAVLLVVVVLAGLQLATAGAHVVDASSRLQGDTSFEGTGARMATWHHAVDAVVDKPVIGWGPGRFASGTTRRYGPGDAGDGIYYNAHNWVLEYASTTGLAGLALLVAWLALAARRARGPLAWFALSYAVFALLEPSSVAITPVALLALGASGPIVALSAARSVRARALTAVGVVLCVVVAVTYLAGEIRMRDAYLDSSTSAWKQAEGLLPSWPEVTYLGARIEAFHALTSRGTTHETRALQLARATTARDPANPAWWSYLGSLELKWGSIGAADAAFAHARDRLPWYPPALRGAVIAADRMGDTAERNVACRRLARVVRRLPRACPEPA